MFQRCVMTTVGDGTWMMDSNRDAHLRAFQRRREPTAGVLLDFDGTLSPIVARPELGEMRDGARAAIGRLVGRYAVVAVVSGRTPPSSESWSGIDGRVARRACTVWATTRPSAMPTGVTAVVDGGGAWFRARGSNARAARSRVHFRGADDPRAAEALLRAARVRSPAMPALEMIGGKKVSELVPGAGR